MDRKSSFTRSFFSLLVLLVVAGTADGLSLEDALATVEQAPSVRAAQTKRNVDRHKHSAARGRFFPTISLTGDWTYLDRTLEIDLEQLRGAMIQLHTLDALERTKLQAALSGTPLTAAQERMVSSVAASQLDAALPPFVETLREQSRFDAELKVVQPIFAGGKIIAAHRATKAAEQQSEASLNASRNERSTTIANAYLGVVLLRQAVDLRRRGLNAIEAHVAQAERLFEEGIVAQTQLLRARLAESQGRAELETEEGRYRTALGVLQLWTGSQTIPSDTLRDLPLPWDSAAVREVVLRENPKMKEILAVRHQLKEKGAAQRGALLPTVAAFGSWQILPRELSALEPRWAVGAQLQIPLFSGGNDWENYKASQEELLYAEWLAKAWEEGLNALVLQGWNRRQTALVHWKSLASAEQLAEESLRSVEKSFAAGLATSLEVVDAHLQLEKTQLGRLQSLSELAQASIELLSLANATGEIVPLWNRGAMP